LRPYLASLSTAGNIPLIAPSDNVRSPAVYVFLRQEVERRLGKSSLLEAVSDGLILWALEGTDPDKNLFMTGDEVIAKIEEVVPPARQFIRGIYRARMEQLASKQNPSGREVRWHKKDDLFCLPYLKQHWPAIREQLLSGTYEPKPVRRVEIAKPDGGVRKLGIPTVIS
jgi:hypothetical protein